ncbi:MAG: hypothetical protein HOY69_38590 [Streptomyces sp.]|nr:hypothetical protein [Streptomyces sp.]
MDARWLQRRVYGADRDVTDPGPQEGREYVELVGGPLDGLLLDVTGLPEADRADGAALITDAGRFGPGGRASYGPALARPWAWLWEGDIP